jgi:hypothetical protein
LGVDPRHYSSFFKFSTLSSSKCCVNKKICLPYNIKARRAIWTSLLSLLGTTPDRAERTFTGQGILLLAPHNSNRLSKIFFRFFQYVLWTVITVCFTFSLSPLVPPWWPYRISDTMFNAKRFLYFSVVFLLKWFFCFSFHIMTLSPICFYFCSDVVICLKRGGIVRLLIPSPPSALIDFAPSVAISLCYSILMSYYPCIKQYSSCSGIP